MNSVERIAEFRKSMPPGEDPYVDLANLRAENARLVQALDGYQAGTSIERFDSDLVLTVGSSEELGPYIQAILESGGNQYSIAERIPNWFVRTFNYAAKRVKDETAQKAKAAKAQEHRQRNTAA